MDTIFITFFIITLTLCSNVLNGMVIYLTQKYATLQEPRMYVRIAYAFFDILYATSFFLHDMVINYMANVPVKIKCLTGDVVTALFFGTIQLTAFIALERYFYFCKPMLYNRIFSLRSITITAISIFVITQTYVLAWNLFYDKEMQTLIRYCGFKQPFLPSSMAFLILVCPAVSVTLFSILSIIRLLNKIEPTPIEISNMVNTEPALRRKAVTHGLR